MDPHGWFVRVLALVSLPYTILAVYRYTAGFFRRV